MAVYRGMAELRHVVPLVAELVVSFDALGSSHRVSLPGLELEMRLPGLEWVDDVPKATTPAGFDERALPRITSKLAAFD